MPRALYDTLAPIYDLWQSADGMTPFALVTHAKLEPALARWGPRVRSFLDLGCATGELLLALQRAHPDWRLAGVDASAPMLEVASRKPGADRIAWLRARIDGPLPLGARFDAAGVFYDTLNHLADPTALARALAAVAQVLLPGGLLIFDLTNALGFERWWSGRNRWTGPGWGVTVATAYDRDARVGRAQITVEHGDETSELGLTERLFTDDEARAALHQVGMVVQSIEPWSPFALDAPGKSLWITRKSP